MSQLNQRKAHNKFFLSLTTVRGLFDPVILFNNNSVKAEGRSKLLRVIEAIKEENKIGTGTFYGGGNFGNTSAMMVIFFSKMFKI